MNGAKHTFHIKIIPPEGAAVYRLRFTRRHLGTIAAGIVLLLIGAIGLHTYQLHLAQLSLSDLRTLTADQQTQLQSIDKEADALASQLHALQKENAEIRRMIGADRESAAPHASVEVPEPHRAANFATVQERLRSLGAASAATRDEARHMQHLALRVLNLRRMASIARERLVAAIPSINPVGGGIASTFGWRTNPWPEFHRGIDLEADYGTTVRAAAAGTVASAGWAGGFGIRVDIDHGNGYHTWYAHLSRVAVEVGQPVTKGEPIAYSGATGEATGPHLHYQVMYLGQAIDPQPYLHGVPPNIMATLPGQPGV